MQLAFMRVTYGEHQLSLILNLHMIESITQQEDGTVTIESSVSTFEGITTPIEAIINKMDDVIGRAYNNHG